MACFAILHRQIGPALKAIALSLLKQQSINDELQKCFEDNLFEPSLSSMKWTKSSIAVQMSTRDGNAEPATVLEIPTFDLASALSSDILTKLVRLKMEMLYDIMKSQSD